MKKVSIFVFSLSLLIVAGSFVSGLNNSNQSISISQDEFSVLSEKSDTVIIDVRTNEEYLNGYIPGAINIPHSDIVSGKVSLEQYQGKNIVFYCHTGVRASAVTEYLEQNSILSTSDIQLLKGNFRAWQARGRNIVRP